MADASALTLRWAFGFNKDVVGGVHNLSDDTRNAVFYVSAHTGVIYDYASRRQRLLQGHCNPITCCCVSEDKRWVATADAGPDSVIVIWDSLNGTPIKTIFNPHPRGVVAMDMSPDAMFLATLSYSDEDSDEPQSLSLWEWTVEREDALYTCEVAANDLQTSVRFNTNDIREIVTNGVQRVIFWSWADQRFKYYSPPLSQRDFKQAVGAFTMSTFVPGSDAAITATHGGDVVLWDKSLVGQNEAYGHPNDRRAIKVIRLNQGAIHFLATVENYLVVGGEDGAVRFYDHQFRVISWFEDLEAGPITSVSFANVVPPSPPPNADPDHSFVVPDFVVGTKKAFIVGVDPLTFNEIMPEDRRGTLLVQGLDDEVHGLATHPSQPQLAVSCYSGAVQLWDYEEKRLLMVRLFDASKLRPQCLGFDPSGAFVAVGFTSGVVKILDSASLEDVATFRHTSGTITELAFARSSSFLATADSTHHVCLWAYTVDQDRAGAAPEQQTEEPEREWVYYGRYQSHSAPITGLKFGVSSDGEQLLVSVGEDKMLVEYDLDRSSVAQGVLLKGQPVKIEQSAAPTACMWHPVLSSEPEDRLVTANDEYKLKQWNAANKTCRRTTLGPTYGGPLNRLQLLGNSDADDPVHYVAYGTTEKVVGLAQLPLDGNPNRAVGLIAHPGEVSGLDVTYDSRFLVTAGGADLTVNLWTINTDVLDRVVAQGGSGVEPFVGLIEGGMGGGFYEEIVDYFYYAQLRSQGENTTKARENTGRVPLAEIPNLMRALGYYPTEVEVQNMCSEVRYSEFVTTGNTVESIDLHSFLKLYVNHRPVFGIGKAQIANAFEVLGAHASGALPWDVLREKLLAQGEPLTEDDLSACLQALIGGDQLPQRVTADTFASDVLGFAAYDGEGSAEA